MSFVLAQKKARCQTCLTPSLNIENSNENNLSRRSHATPVRCLETTQLLIGLLKLIRLHVV